MATQIPELIPVSIVDPVPNYATFQQPIVAVGKIGSAPGELHSPKGVSIDTESGHIYVAELDNSRIQIFSETGDCLNEFGQQDLAYPWGILFHQDSIYVTDVTQHAIFLFKLPDLRMVKRAGKEGSGNKEFNFPSQLAISPNQRLYVPDTNNKRIQILSTDLAFQDSLRHQTMTEPVDVKFTNSEMFVLSCIDNPCIHVFTLSGEKSRSIITNRGIGMQVTAAFFFCLDGRNNIVISDFRANNIKIFSPAGDLLHTLGRYGNQAGNFDEPSGIAILNNTKLLCVSLNLYYAFQIFS